MRAQLYLVTPPVLAPEAFAPVLDAALAGGGVACVRLALDTADEAAWRRAAAALLEVTAAHDVALVAEDRVALVAPLGLDGVHLASFETSPRDARQALGRDHIVGAFAGTSKHRALTLAEMGADYIALGPVAEVDPELLAFWAEAVETPLVVEGWVSVEQTAELATCADFVVPDRAIWDAPDPAVALAAYRQALAS